MSRIDAVRAFEILDSRGRPTVEAEVVLEDGTLARASVPSGASTGRHEALELRDGDPDRYGGRGVLRAAAHVTGEIAERLRGMDAADQAAIDAALVALDGTPERSRLGGNALLAASVACARAGAASLGLPLWRHLGGAEHAALPRPMVNALSGGLHAGRAVDLQDYLAIPLRAETFPQAIEDVSRVLAALAVELGELGRTLLRADEGGFAAFGANEDGLIIVTRAIERAGLEPGRDVAIGLDVAASHFATAAGYRLAADDAVLDAAAWGERVADWTRRYPVVSVEDPFGEDDWPAWPAFTAAVGDCVQVIGDDLLCTQLDRLERAIGDASANAVLVKANQVGTLTEALAVAARARAAGWRAVVSARSGETEDDWLADLAIAAGPAQLKVGSLTRSERLAKYNRLLRESAVRADGGRLEPWGDA
ncbi:MAG: phosphopyruvate hydratase [Actinobacteria bacterium]|nr:phosphopyruvate hydratase [Actinomycetota bacterium]